MNKRQIIDDIRQYNKTAAPQFLAQFDVEALQQYLSNLEAAKRKHVTVSNFVSAHRGPRVTAGAAA